MEHLIENPAGPVQPFLNAAIEGISATIGKGMTHRTKSQKEITERINSPVETYRPKERKKKKNEHQAMVHEIGQDVMPFDTFVLAE